MAFTVSCIYCQELSCPDACKDFKKQIVEISDPTNHKSAFLVGLSKKSLWIMEVLRTDLEHGRDLTTAQQLASKAPEMHSGTAMTRLCSMLSTVRSAFEVRALAWHSAPCFSEVHWRKLMDLPGSDADNSEGTDGESDEDEDELRRPPRLISKGPRPDQVIIFSDSESGISAASSHYAPFVEHMRISVCLLMPR